MLCGQLGFDMALDPTGIPPFERIHVGPPDQDREMKMIAARESGRPGPAQHLSAFDHFVDLPREVGELPVAGGAPAAAAGRPVQPVTRIMLASPRAHGTLV